VARLARFNVTTATVPHDKSGKAKYFEGLPIPTSLILVGGMAACLLLGKFEGAESISMTGGAWQFTNRLVGFASGSSSSTTGKTGQVLGLVKGYQYGVPFGKAVVGLRDVAALVGIKLGPHLRGTREHWIDKLTVEFHWVSLVWLAWSVAMVSKTLRVPKP
jgi:CDP-diacylglycerol--serine O-phosphatidyltransferase